MWSLILYFLFGIGQPSSSQPTQGNPTMQTTNGDEGPGTPTDGDNGGENGTVRPPRK